jgi:dienelactone hydrolase
LPDLQASALESMSSQDFLNALNASIRYLEARPQVSKTKIGMIGFGLGGSLTWFTLAANKDIKAAVVFDAQTPDPSAAPQITTPVLALFGENDKTSAEGLQPFDDAMKKAGAAWQSKVEPKAGRGFFDDARTTYAPDAAKDAWKLALDWFNKYLRS